MLPSANLSAHKVTPMKRYLPPQATGAATKLTDATDRSFKKGRLAQDTQQAAATNRPAALEHGWTELGQQARFGYFPRLLSGMSDHAMRTLLYDIQWQQRDLVIFGRTVAQPRLIAYMADPTTPPYTYSGLTLQQMPWTEVKAAVEQLHPGTQYNSCLLNLYKDGSHHVSWHSDNEKLYGSQPTIASVSFGAARDFVLRHNLDRSRKISTTLSAGDVLIMAGTMQEHWQHSIPKRKGVTEPRINLTFRRIVESPGSQNQQQHTS